MTSSDTLAGVLATCGPAPRRYPIEQAAHGVTNYGPWRIYYDPPPIPFRGCDWHWVHDDYDGAPTYSDDGFSADKRCGSCASFADALNECDEWEDENTTPTLTASGERVLPLGERL